MKYQTDECLVAFQQSTFGVARTGCPLMGRAQRFDLLRSARGRMEEESNRQPRVAGDGAVDS